jgi:hypothetical protein
MIAIRGCEVTVDEARALAARIRHSMLTTHEAAFLDALDLRVSDAHGSVTMGPAESRAVLRASEELIAATPEGERASRRLLRLSGVCLALLGQDDFRAHWDEITRARTQPVAANAS